MAHLLQKLHSLLKFPYRINYFDTREKRFITKFRASNILPESATKDLFELYERIAHIYPRYDEENLASCHNDLKGNPLMRICTSLFSGTFMTVCGMAK
jgi:thiamine kinase-like enzyme